MPFTKEQLQENKFYIGSASVMERRMQCGKGWGHPTIEQAIEHAQKLMDKKYPETSEVFIVQIVRVVKRKLPEVDVEVVE